MLVNNQDQAALQSGHIWSQARELHLFANFIAAVVDTVIYEVKFRMELGDMCHVTSYLTNALCIKNDERVKGAVRRPHSLL